MSALIEKRSNTSSTPVTILTTTDADALPKSLTSNMRRWARTLAFSGKAGEHVLCPDDKGKLARVLAGSDPADPLWSLAGLPQALPEGTYHLDAALDEAHVDLASLGWALGAYRFGRYKQNKPRKPARLAVTRGRRNRLTPLIEAVTRVRDLVNTPAEDMGPAELAGQIKKLARTHKAKVREWVGNDLLKHGYPTIHAVGRAGTRAPRLVELTWGRKSDPKLALVGKGVCFDTGGLDLKGATGMRWMKKDMGGAAHVIALAGLIMQTKLPVHLTLLVPAVENNVHGNAIRPGDVVRTRAGRSVEIDNTDAEGRLVLCDALAHAVETDPDLIVDFATLTGAARVALGPDLPALFSNRDDLAEAATQASAKTFDPLWRMPLWQPYRRMLDSCVADSVNSPASRHAGAITAALYLQQFVPDSNAWMHFDVYAWNDRDRPGRPRGGEAMALRAMYAMLDKRYR